MQQKWQAKALYLYYIKSLYYTDVYMYGKRWESYPDPIQINKQIIQMHNSQMKKYIWR